VREVVQIASTLLRTRRFASSWCCADRVSTTEWLDAHQRNNRDLGAFCRSAWCRHGIRSSGKRRIISGTTPAAEAEAAKLFSAIALSSSS
jgi:hypothetical protein